MDGRRQIRRYVPELNAEGVQDLPPEDLRRYAFKMATGSGKTWVMAMAMVWSHFHKKRVPVRISPPISSLSLRTSSSTSDWRRILPAIVSSELPLIPPEWRGTWSQKVILRGESTEPDPAGNSVPHQHPAALRIARPGLDAAECNRSPPGPQASSRTLAAYQPSMLERVKELETLSCSTTKPTTSMTKTWPGASPCSASTALCRRGCLCGSIFPPLPRIRMACTSPGQCAITRWPRRWRTGSSRRRSS